MKDIAVYFEFNPLGNLKVEWQIPMILLKEKKSIDFEIPGYKYDLPKFAGIPVPFSSKAFLLNTRLITLPEKVESEFKDGLYGSRTLALDLSETSKNKDYFTFSYEVENILNNDGIYFVAVYPFRSPFVDKNHSLIIKAKYSYNIRVYKFWERYFSHPDNKSIKRKENLHSIKKGDEITITGIIKPENNFTLNLHLTGTRFPFLIRRDRFWMTIYLIIIFVFLSPYLVELFKFLF